MKVFIKTPGNESVPPIDEVEMTFEQLMSEEDAGVTSVNINDILDFISFDDRIEAIKGAVTKLRYGGKLSMSGLDLLGMSRLLERGALGVPAANKLMRNRLSMDTLHNVLDQFTTQNGMSIYSCKVDGHNYNIVIERLEVSTDE